MHKEKFGKLELDSNWGSFNTYSNLDGTESIVVEWRTDRVVKRFKGDTAHEDADKWAHELHYVHDLS
jgi:hypothetical protein